MIVKKFKKKTITEAIQFTGSNNQEIAKFTGYKNFSPNTKNPDYDAEVFDVLHQTFIPLKVGDWIAKGPRGECYPIEQSVMADTYEEITEGLDTASETC